MASKMTRAEKERRQAAKQNEKAKKKEEAKKGKSNSSSSLNLPKLFDEPKEKKSFAQRFAEDTKKLDLGRKTEREKEQKRQTSAKNTKYNPLIKAPTRMQKDTSPEIDNFAEAVVRKGAQGVESALVGHSDRRNMKKAEDILTGEYNNRVNPFVRTGQRMKVDDPVQVAKAEAEAKKAGFQNLADWEIRQANDLIHRNDDFYKRKAELDADVEAQNYSKAVGWIPEASEVIGSMIPTMVAGAATGGIAGVAGLTGRAAMALQHIVTGGEIADRVSGQEARAMYEAVLAEKNKTDLNIDDYRDAIKKANTTGELVGLAEAGTEMLFGGIAFLGKGLLDHTAGKIGFELLSPATKAAIKGWQNTTSGRICTAVAQRLGGAIGEGMEEAIMSIAQPAIESNVAGVDSEFSIKDMIRDFGMGAAVSMVLGLPVTVADTAEAAEGKINFDRVQKELQDMVSAKAQELVKRGEMSAEDAANINAQVSDIRKGKGVLTQSETKEETKVTGENLDKVYSDFDEAREAMKAEAKGMKNGETVRARFMQDGEVKTWESKVANGGITTVQQGITTNAEKVAYAEKAKRVASATNTAERTGYQLNVKDEIVKEVSALSKAFNREVEFYYDENSAVHGNVDLNTGKIYVNANSSQSPAAAVIAHEMTHLLENTSSYKTLTNMMQKYYASSLEDKRNEIIAIYKSNPEAMKTILDENDEIRMDVIDSEVMAAFIEEKLLTDYNTIRELTRTDRTLAQKIVDWLNKVIQKITGSREQKFLIEARDIWSKALKEGKVSTTTTEGEQITSDTVEEVRYSQGNDKKLMDKADARNHATHAVEQEVLDEAREAREAIKDKYSDLFIADSVSERKSPLVGNDSYAGSLDSTTICSRSLTLEAIVELVAKKFDRPLTNAEAIVVAQELMEYTGDRAECLYCYQANAKRGYEDALGAFIRERRTVIDNHRNGMDKDTNFKLMMNFNFEKGTWGKKPTDAAKDRFNTYIKIAEGKIPMAPASGMLNTRTLYASIADKKNPQYIIDQYKQARTYAQGAVKAHGRVYYAVYNGQVLRVKQEKIDDWNRTYGLRMYSFSDFSPAFILENMQMVTDAAVRGLRMLAYTKEPEFVSIFGDTGMAINISIAGVPDGNGGYHSDGMQGMDWETAKELRDRYPAAGTVYVAKDDAEVEWAMSQDWIDTVIPFHISYGSGMMQRSMGWTNYSGQQSEKKEKGWTKEMKTTIYPSEHQNDRDTYLRLCEENLLTPKFPKWIDNPNYMKLVNETRLAPENMAPVQPVFNLEAAEESLEQFAKAGGYNPILGGSEANRNYIVEDIAERVKNRAPEVEARDKRFSVGKITEEDTAKSIQYVSQMDPVVNITGQEFPRIEGQKVNDRILKYMNQYRLYNSQVGEIIFNNRSIKDDLAHGVGKLKIASYVAVPQVLNEGKVVTYRENWKDRGYDTLTIAAPITVDGNPYFEGVILKRTQDGNRFYLHEVWMEEDKKNSTASSQPGGSDAVDSGNAVLSMNSILQRIIDVKYGNRTAEDVARDFMDADPYETRYSIGKPTDTKAERKDAEATDRLYDAQLEDVIENAPELTQEELRSIDNSIEYTKEQVAKELAQLADNYREGKGRKKKAKRKGGGKDLTGKLRVIGKQGGRKIYTDKKKDDERRELRLKIAEKWFKQNEPKTKPGSAKALYFKNRSAMELMDEFRRGVMTYLVERDMFIPAESGGVVVDEHNAEIAIRDTMTGEWDISRRRNTYTPSLKLTYLAEAEGLDVDQFHTMYSQIKFRMEHIDPNGERHYKRKDVVAYINSLNITSKQKWFLYFDVAGYARSTAPAFASYGPVKEEKGNQRGNMIKALDNIAVDMFAGAMKDPDIYDGSHRITHEDILAFADTVYGKEDTKSKEEFMLFFTGRIITYADKMMEMRAVERTNLLTDKPKEADPYKAKILRIYRNLKKELIAEGEAFERMADKLNNPLIRARYYDAKKSLGIANEMINGRHQRNINGEVTGKGLHEIFKPVFKADEKAGNNNMMTELTLLVNCRHDIDRLKYDKGYTGYTAEECEAHIERISKEHKWLVDIADELVQYSKNLLQMCVDCGRISEEDQRYFNEKYPYYVPTFRLLNNQYYDREGNIVKRTNSVIKTAVGGTEDVLPLFDQLVRRTQEIVKACKKNQLATELAKTFTNPKSAEYIINIDETVYDEDKEDSIDKLGAVEELGRNRKKENGTDNIIPWYCAGIQHDIIIADENMLYGWDRINYMRKEAEVGKIMRKINAFRRAVLTQYNPTFFLTNHIKDVNDMFLYNQHAQRLPKYYALAWKTMVAGKTKDGKNRDYLEEYLSHGMAQTSIFEYDLSNSGRRTKKMKAKKVLMALPDGFNEVNFIVEQVPRLAVYMETVDRLESQRTKGGNTYTDEEIKTIAGYQASDATLNFGRSGTFVKAANTYGCTFLNAGVQGMDRFRRMFTQIKDGNKQAVAMNVIGLAVKSILLGLGSNWILDWIYGGDDEAAKWIREFLYEEDADRIKQEYLEMADYQRLNYFLFAWPFGEQETWIRIPRGRVAAYFYSWAYNGEKVFSGEMDALELIQTQWDMAKDTILPPNPVYENIIGPFLDVARNKDAWGEEIVTSYEDQGEGYSYLEYDEDTTDMAIMLAEFAHKLTGDSDTGMSRILDISPKKLDYIVEQYLGSYADLIMPMMNKDFDFKSGTLNALESLAKKFYIDPTLSNRLAGDYYDLSELYQNVATANEDDTPYAVSSEIFATVNTQLKPLREASKEVSKATSMTRGEAFGYLDDLIAQAEMSGTDTGMIEEFRDSLRSNGNTRGDLSRKEIQQLNRVIKDQMNQIYRTATSDAKSLQEYASANYYGKEGNSALYKEWYQNNKSAEWQITKITATSETAKENWKSYSEAGGDAKSFVDFYNYYSMTNSTYDKDGDSVRGQGKKDKCVNFLHNMDISADLKKQLYLSVGGWSEKKMPRFTDGAKGSMDIALDLQNPLGEAGEVALGFMVDNNGHVQIKAASGSPVGSAMVGSVEKIARSEKYGDSIFIKSTDKSGNTVIIQYFGLDEVGGKKEGGIKKYDYIEAGDVIGKVGKDGLKFKVTVNGKPVDPATYLDLGTASNIDTEGYTITKIGEEERDDEEKVASSGGGYGGGRGGSGGSGGGSVSVASGGRNSTNYDSVTKLTNGQKNYNGSGVMLPTAAEIASMNLYQNYGAKGTYLPKASDYNNGVQLSSYEGSVPTTPKTTRTGTQGMTGVTNVTPETQGTWRTKDKHWDDTVLS